EINDITNRESTTLITSVNTTANVIPIYIIFKTDPIEEFIYNDLNNSVRFTKSPTGFLNTDLTLN
ncbi:hypothetical protein GE21DRAFT_1202250, partial [Neurospora crassa]